MRKCCVCRNEIASDKHKVLLFGNACNRKEICTVCEQKIAVLTKESSIEKTKDAVNYLYTCSLSSSDTEVRAFLEEKVEAGGFVVQRMEAAKTENEPVNTANKRDYFAEKEAHAKNGVSG